MWNINCIKLNTMINVDIIDALYSPSFTWSFLGREHKTEYSLNNDNLINISP